MKKQTLRLSLASCLFAISQGVWADSFVLQDIQVTGLTRLNPATVLSNVPVKVGQQFDDRMTGQVVRSLYGTGLFDDISLSRRGNVLVVNVQERVTVADIKLKGNSAIDDKALLGALRSGGIAPGRPLDRAALARFEQELQRQYITRGTYGASVNTQLKPAGNGKVAVNVNINEGTTARIRDVKITGNRAFPEDLLKRLLESGPKRGLSLFNGKGQYSREKLVADLDRLKKFYLDRGFLRFEVLSSQASLSQDKRSVFININIREGDQYRVGKVNVVGTRSAAIQKMVKVRTGEVFSQSRMNDTRKYFSEEMGKYGYAFAKVNVVPNINEVNKTVDLTFELLQGQRTYVRRIVIKGNYRC